MNYLLELWTYAQMPLGIGSVLLFLIGVRRGVAILIERWGTEGRVVDLASRLSCSNCKAKRKRKPRIYVEVIKLHRSKSEQPRASMTQVDALVYDIGQLKPNRTIE
jgi:hypothetical protein